MSVNQENFDAAVTKAAGTLAVLLDAGLQLGEESDQVLQDWLWDLEAVAAAIRVELVGRSDQPVDFG